MDEAGQEPMQDERAPVDLPKVPTGIRGLDEVLAGGLPAGRTTLVSGGPGTGKTVLALEFLYRAALEGEPGVLVSFEERDVALRANAASLGWDVEGLEAAGRLCVVHPRVSSDTVVAGQFDLRGLLSILEGHCRRIGARRVALDAVDVLLRRFGDAEREREQLELLHDRLRDLGLTALLTLKAAPEHERVYPFLDYMVDCVIHLDQRISGQIRTRRLQVVKYRGSDFLTNEQPYEITPNGVGMVPISGLALTARAFGGRVPSGLEGLDDALGGGLLEGSCILLAGPTGAGKTILAASFARAACARGDRVLYVNLEESREAMIEGVRAAGVDLATAQADGLLRTLTMMPESRGADRHLLDILEEVDRFGPGHVVVDAITACRRMGSDQAAADLVIRLLGLCARRRITCLLTNQLRAGDDLREPSGLGIASLVDCIVVLRFVEVGDRVERRLLVLKSRGSNHDMRWLPVTIDDTGARIAPGGASRGTPGRPVGGGG